MVNIQTARELPKPEQAFRDVLLTLGLSAKRDLPQIERPSDDERSAMLNAPTSAIKQYLSFLSEKALRPLVVLIDEADGLVGQTMVSFLTQLRARYIDRSETPFPHSLALIGMRQVRDFVFSTQERNAVS